jgi:hypothetical protein
MFSGSWIIGSGQWWCCEDLLLCQSKTSKTDWVLVGEDGIGPRGDLTCEAVNISCTLWRSTRKKGLHGCRTNRRDQQRAEQVAVKKQKRKRARKKEKAIIQESPWDCP